MNKKLAEERLIDWLLYNIDIIKILLKEMAYLESTVVYNDYVPGTTATDRMEKIIVFVDESMQIIKVVENAIERLSDDLFDALISIYFDGKTLKESAEVLGNTVDQVRYKRKRIQRIIRDQIDDNDIELEKIYNLQRILRIGIKKAS